MMASLFRRHAALSLRKLTQQELPLATPQAFKVVNEPLLDFRAGSADSKKLEEALKRQEDKIVDVPIVVGDEEIRTKHVCHQVRPFDHQKPVATFYHATPEVIRKAINTSLKVRKEWERRPQEERGEIFLRAADLLAHKYRMDIMAATILGQAKNIVQAEIDASAELIDFLRFDVMFAQKITEYQPASPDTRTVNSMIYRGMEGFWSAVCPFNFTAIGGHLPMAPALVGNVSLWKPSDTAVLSNYIAFQAYREAGLPPGVINFLPSDGPTFGDTVTSSPDLVGINFTGSAKTFKHLWRKVAENIDVYKTFPRLIGECGGKNMHFIHNSADVESVVMGTIRAAYEYNGQKCSACSRLYVPQSLWPMVKSQLLDVLREIKVGSPLKRSSFVTAVIDSEAFARIKQYLDFVKSDQFHTILAGGACDDSKGYFVEPTLVETSDPESRMMTEEIFGPILTVYPYPDDQLQQTVTLAARTSPYGLTGAVYTRDPQIKAYLKDVFRDAVGNFYINDKCTGAVVGQQPFGGARISGTNDKAGGPHYLLKFISVQSAKESFDFLREWKYPSMKE